MTQRNTIPPLAAARSDLFFLAVPLIAVAGYVASKLEGYPQLAVIGAMLLLGLISLPPLVYRSIVRLRWLNLRHDDISGLVEDVESVIWLHLKSSDILERNTSRSVVFPVSFKGQSLTPVAKTLNQPPQSIDYYQLGANGLALDLRERISDDMKALGRHHAKGSPFDYGLMNDYVFHIGPNSNKQLAIMQSQVGRLAEVCPQLQGIISSDLEAEALTLRQKYITDRTGAEKALAVEEPLAA